MNFCIDAVNDALDIQFTTEAIYTDQGWRRVVETEVNRIKEHIEMFISPVNAIRIARQPFFD